MFCTLSLTSYFPRDYIHTFLSHPITVFRVSLFTGREKTNRQPTMLYKIQPNLVAIDPPIIYSPTLDHCTLVNSFHEPQPAPLPRTVKWCSCLPVRGVGRPNLNAFRVGVSSSIQASSRSVCTCSIYVVPCINPVPVVSVFQVVYPAFYLTYTIKHPDLK